MTDVASHRQKLRKRHEYTALSLYRCSHENSTHRLLRCNSTFRLFAESGDIVLFKSKGWGTRVQRYITSSEFDHVGIVLRVEEIDSTDILDLVYKTVARISPSGLYILEAVQKQGVICSPWEDFYEKGWGRQYHENIVLRKLIGLRNTTFQLTLWKFAYSHVGNPYDISFTKLLCNAPGGRKQVSGNLPVISRLSHSGEEIFQFITETDMSSSDYTVMLSDRSYMSLPRLDIHCIEEVQSDELERTADSVTSETFVQDRRYWMSKRKGFFRIRQRRHNILRMNRRNLKLKSTKRCEFEDKNSFYNKHYSQSFDVTSESNMSFILSRHFSFQKTLQRKLCMHKDHKKMDNDNVETLKQKESEKQHRIKNKKQPFFCSELVAEALKSVGVFSDDTNTANFWPVCFTLFSVSPLPLENNYSFSGSYIKAKMLFDTEKRFPLWSHTIKTLPVLRQIETTWFN